MIEAISKSIAVMRKVYGKDLSIYNQAFLIKALEKRWAATGVNNTAEYCNCLEKNSAEADLLYRSLQVTFSQFFRDPLTFTLLEQHIFPSIASQKAEGSEIRIWSAGCANGQEAYSLAILLADPNEISEKEIRYRIIATDISEEALVAGKAGIYNQDSLQNVKKKHLDKYFSRHGNTYMIAPQLKRSINFSAYDLLDQFSDNPPESIYGDFDLVICSNLMIYYGINIQRVIINKLQKAMSATGYLVTGETEKAFVEKTTNYKMITMPAPIFQNNK